MAAVLWQERRVIVCVGTGGVGKTTSAAALALSAALGGRRVAVMTIDPSKRLAQALGIDAADPSLQHVALDGVTGGGQTQGSLHALILDVQHTFDSLIEARARTPEHARAILNNRIYKHFSASLAGSHEYAAVEKLYDIYERDDIDLVVLDTPPSHHALDFLDAPGRILRFLQGQEGLSDSGAKPDSFARRMGRKLFDLGGSVVTKTVGRVSGAQTLQEVTEFLGSLRNMYASFNARALAVHKLLRSDEVAFALVGAPTRAQILALEHFTQELARTGIRPAARILNRVRQPIVAPQHCDALQQALSDLKGTSDLTQDDVDALWQATNEGMALADRDQAQVRALVEAHPQDRCITLADCAEGADSLPRLAQMGQAFMG